MSLILANEFVEFCESKNKFWTAKELYKLGMKFGITNSEMYENFLGKKRAVKRGQYLPKPLPEADIAYAIAMKDIKNSKAAKTVLDGTATTTHSKSLDASIEIVKNYDKAKALEADQVIINRAWAKSDEAYEKADLGPKFQESY